MSLLKKLGLGPKDAAEAVVETAEGVADIVERWKPSEKAKHDMQRETFSDEAKATDEARQYDPRTVGTNVFSEWVNVGVDALNRLIRPGVAIILVGGTFGLWELRVETTDPIVLGWTQLVVGFYFGVRAITQDLPALLKALKNLRNS
jgi:hypothetical protein